MRTDQLVQALVADTAARGPPLARACWLALVPGSVIAAIGFSIVLGPRPDIAEAITTWRIAFKFVVTLCLTFTAMRLALTLARPGADARPGLLALATAPLLLAIGVTFEFVVVPATTWGVLLVGNYSVICLASIPLLSLAPLVALLTALRRGAPTSPGWLGAVAGLVAGGLGATLYASHCTDDSPLFVATWYMLAISIVVVAGSLAGRRLLRW